MIFTDAFFQVHGVRSALTTHCIVSLIEKRAREKTKGREGRADRENREHERR